MRKSVLSRSRAETCEPVNPFQMIVNLQTAPNVTDDPVLLAEALPDLKVRTDLYSLYTDGGFGSPAGRGRDPGRIAHHSCLLDK